MALPAKSQQQVEMRKFDRLNVDIAATAAPSYAGVNGAVPVNVKDLSVSGLFFLSTRRFIVGMSLQIELQCLGRRVVVDAIVRHCRRRSDIAGQYGIGVQFLNTVPVRGALPLIAGFLEQERDLRNRVAAREFVISAPEPLWQPTDRMSALLREKDAKIAELTRALQALRPN